MTFLPLYLQNAFGMSAIDAGLGMLPFAFAMIAGPSLGAALAARVSSGGVLAGGLALIGAGTRVTAALTASGDYRLVAIGMFVTGCGAGIMNGDTQKAIMACVPPTRHPRRPGPGPHSIHPTRRHRMRGWACRCRTWSRWSPPRRCSTVQASGMGSCSMR